MPEKDPGATAELETPADLKKKLAKLEAERAKDRQKIADLQRKNGTLTKSLVELRDRLDSLTKQPKQPSQSEIDNNNDQVRENYDSGANAYAEGMAQFREQQENNNRVRESYNTGANAYAEGMALFREQNNPNGVEVQPDVDSSLEVRFGEYTFEKGDIVIYTSNEGEPREYYVLANTIDEQPGLVLQSVENEGFVFAISGNTDPNRIRPKEPRNADPIPEPPATNPPGPEEPDNDQPEGENEAITAAQEALREHARRLDGIVADFARRRVESERIFSGGRARSEMQLSAEELNRAFSEWSASLARLIAEQNRDLREQTQLTRDQLNEARSQLQQLEAMPEAERPANYQDLAREIGNNIRTLENENSQNEQNEALVQAGLNAQINEKLMEVRARVDFEMIAERERRHPKLAKVGEWLRNHKKTRMVAGVVLAGAGFVGAATGNIPLVSVSVAGRAALRGFGGYTATKAGGEWLADRQFNKADINGIEDYTDAAQRQSLRKRRWSRGAGVVGAGLAAAPFIGNALHTTPEAPPTAPKPPDWLNSREFAEMVHHPNTFQNFMKWTESMKAQGWTDAKIAEALSKLPPAPEGFGS